VPSGFAWKSWAVLRGNRGSHCAASRTAASCVVSESQPLSQKHVAEQLVWAHVTTAVSFVEPLGCEASHADAHAASEQPS
jgi:hypothetical protein